MGQDYTITLEQALERLSLRDPLELRFEKRPNNDSTYCDYWPREHAVEILTTAAANGNICESGPAGQEQDFGIYITATHEEWGRGLIFFKTRPEKRVAPGDLIRREREELGVKDDRSESEDHTCG